MQSFFRFVGWLAGAWILIVPSAGAGQKPESRELIVLLAHGPGVPTPERVVETASSRKPLPAELGVGNPRKVEFGLVHRAQGRLKELLQAHPDSPRARLERYLRFTYPEGANLEAIQAALERNPNVLYVERNLPFKLHASPSDPLFPNTGNPVNYQWGSHLLNFPAAWDYAKGHAYVGLVDTGVQVSHPEIRAFSLDGQSYQGGNFRAHLSIDIADSDADVDERGPDATGLSPSGAGHGTHVSGIVAGTANNSLGVAGGCWSCSLLMAKATNNRNGKPTNLFLADIANSLNWLVDHGVQVASMSLGVGGLTCDGATAELGMLCTALAHAESRDVLMSASSGNDKLDIDFPASDPRVLAIGGIESSGAPWDWADEGGCPCQISSQVRQTYSSLCNSIPTFECGSNYTVTPGSARQDLVAPAKQVLSTFYENRAWSRSLGCHDTDVTDPVTGQTTNHAGVGYDLCTGTSMSSPHVAAVAGILRSVNPLLTKSQVADLLTSNASRAGNWDPKLGYGVPNASESVQDALGRAGGTVLANRLTPLFSLYSSTVGDFFYTTVPQMAAAAIWDSGSDYIPQGPGVPGYHEFPGDPGCQVGPCFFMAPSASVYIFTSDKPPYPAAPPLVPLYRMTDPGQDTTYTTEPNGILAFKNLGYELDGIEGYIYKRCTPEPSCIPAGAVRLWRLYHYGRDDYAIFPESELAAMQAAGYTSTSGTNDWIGYVYPNVDSDGDNVINGFEGLIGIDPTRGDSDCDGLSDGTETLSYPYGDPLGSPGCVPKRAQFISQSIPAAMVAEQSYAVSMTVRNTGTLTWSPVGSQCNAYRLGSANPLNNTTWGPSRIELPGPVAPGQQVTLSFTVTAPAAAGTYNFQRSMVHECVEWFGDASPNVAVSVRAVKPRFSFSCTGLSCGFDASSSTASAGIASYSWSFGDSITGSGVTTGHAFPQTGVYTVTLTVTDSQGLQAATSRKVSVTDTTPPPAQSYFTVAPCRLLDTRASTPLTAGQPYVFNVAGNCGIPATAKAVSVNVIVVSPTGPGHLAFHPGNLPSAPFPNSTINFTPAATPRANNAILRLATNGAGTLAVAAGIAGASPAQTHLIVEVEGYFSEDLAPAPGAQGPLGYQTVTPCRLADTRNPASPLTAGVPRNFTVQGVCGIPAGAASASLNLAVVSPTDGGWLTAWQAGTPIPPVSTLSFIPGTLALANGARPRLAASTPDLAVQYLTGTAGATAHAVLDTTGYFKSDAPLKYRPVSPCRLLDTRFADQGGPIMAAGETRAIQVQGNCGIPIGAKAAVLNVVALAPSAQGHLNLYPSGIPLPLASTLNYHPAQGNTANGTIVPLSTQANDVAITNAVSSTHVIVDVFGYFQ